MKKVLKIGLMFAALLCFSISMQAQKYGYVNSNAILESMPEAQQLEPELKSLQKQLNKKLEQMIAEYQEKITAAQKKAERGEMSPIEQENTQTALLAEQQKMAKFEQEIQSKLMEKQQVLLAPILERVNNAISDVAKSEGYTMIFDSAVLLYADENQDLSTMVKSKLGL